MERHIGELAVALQRLRSLDGHVAAAVALITRSLSRGGKLLVAGNGGSAAEAHHLVGELLGRFRAGSDRAPLPAIALHGDSCVVTGISNDFGYQSLFARQVEALAGPEDVLVVISTSGSSPNLVAAVAQARRLGTATVALSGGRARALHMLCDVVLAVPSTSIEVVQECHLVLIHVMVEQIERTVGASTGRGEAV
jgi:phosphoheptose isomerase